MKIMHRHLTIRIVAFLICSYPFITYGYENKNNIPTAAEYDSRLAAIAINSAVTKKTPNPITLLPTGKEWISHIENDLMPFWTSKTAIGTPPGNFPTYRANDGSMIDTSNPPPEYTSIPNSETWIKNNQRVVRYYSRMMGRQVFAYCAAFHLTGNEKYLELAKLGLDYMMQNMVDPNGVFYTWTVNKKGYPEDPDCRISQDLTYAIMAPAAYYYLTRDSSTLAYLLKAKDYIFKKYKFPDCGQLRWVNKNYTDPADSTDKSDTTQKELVAQLDQINAYMLLTTGLLEGENRKAWLKDMVMLATSMKDNYYSAKNNLFWGCIAGPSCKQELGQPHVDFGHTIKTFWMMYLMGKKFNKPLFVDFANKNMPRVFQSAYDTSMKTWKEKPKTPDNNGTDRIWWLHDELDQAAATLSLIDTTRYLKYLVPTYHFWFKHYIDQKGKEVWHGMTGPVDQEKPLYLKAHLWKNAFHASEHALVGYITSQALARQPVELYYAFVKEPADSLIQPYLFRGDIKKVDSSPMQDLKNFKNLKKYKVTFSRIKP